MDFLKGRKLYIFLFAIFAFGYLCAENEVVAKDIFEIEEKDFEEIREVFSKRPRPDDLVFKEADVKKYIDSLPENLRESEKKRYEIIKGTKDHIIRLFERNTMEIKDSIKLRSGRSISGTISLANDRVFIVRKSKSSKGQTYKWSDLSFEGYAEILDQFAKKRLKIKGGSVSAEESKKYAANDYVLLTILSDWYGEYKLVKEFAEKAVEIRPEIKDQLNELLFN